MSGSGALRMAIALPSGAVLQGADVDWDPCCRVIASEYAGENLFDQIADQDDLDDLLAIADLTNPHVRDQTGQIHLVPPEDRIYGAGVGLIMAAFAWPGKPSRFSDGTLGTFYGANSESTAVRETVYHLKEFLLGSGPAVIEMTLLHAHLTAHLVDTREGQPCPDGMYLDRDYTAGQAFGALVRGQGGYGILYSSVRDPGGECAAVFRPPALAQCSAIRTLEYRWDGREIDVR